MRKATIVAIFVIFILLSGWLLIATREENQNNRAWCADHGHHWIKLRDVGVVCVNKDGYLLLPDSP